MVKPRWFLFLLPLLFVSTHAVSGNLSKSEKDWLRKVDFIITSEERNIFRKKLNTSYEREQFVKLFWARRDPDLGDGVNTFRDEYLARYDYVRTHFETGNRKIPQDDRSYIYILLGKPSRVEPRVDVIIMGPRWRNQYLQHQPELWTYDEPDFDYKKSKLKIQMIPTSTFGDYVAITDNFSMNWIRRLKYRFILHPEMETPPIESIDAKNFQGVVDASQEQSSLDDASDDTFEPENQASTRKEPIAATVSAPDATVETTLATPARTDVGLTKIPEFSFRRAAGNDLALTCSWGYFTSGSGNELLLGRIGLQLNKMAFTHEKDQYQAPLSMTYRLMDAKGQPVLGDQLETVIRAPSRETIEDKTKFYTKDFAVLLASGRYRLLVQAEQPDHAKASFFETEIEIPPLDGKVLRATRLTLMDPNVHPSVAKFQINGKPFAPSLSQQIVRGDPLYPVLELTGAPGEEAADSMQVHAIRDGNIVKTWVLYPEERTETPHGTVLVHPVLRTQALSPGDYQLRFEMELPSGVMLLSEQSFSLIQ